MSNENFDQNEIKLIRKRYLPDEEINISGDKIIHLDKHLLVTEWLPINPRMDMSRGISYWYLDKGWKISKIYNVDGSFKHYYCDICKYEVVEGKSYKIIDLLADVIIDVNGNYKVLDFEELTDMLEAKKLPPKDFIIKNFAALIETINSGKFPLEEMSKY